MQTSTPFFIYIVECRDGSYYTGMAKNVAKRVALHNTGKGAKYTNSRKPVKLVYSEQYATKSEALKREHQIKKLTRIQKIELITKQKNII